MSVAKLARYVVNSVLAAVYVGMPIFAVEVLYPVLARNRNDVAELRTAQRMLGLWLSQENLPTQTRIQSELAYTEGMRVEYERLCSYFRRRNGMLERSLLDTPSGYPAEVKLRYQKFKADLEERARLELAQTDPTVGLLPAYPWEKQGRPPPKSTFALMEKRACIADALVGLLSSSTCALGHVAVGGPPSQSDEVKMEAEDEPLRYVRWPVTVRLLTPFHDLPEVLNRIVAPPSRYPCVVLRAVRVEAVATNRVAVQLSLDVLEFG
ncbi:MAG: hypothetical protein ACYTFZ_01940 [Planctomycetota bacterium]|jgi:hypothetical protein